MITNIFASLTKRHHFRVSRGIGIGEVGIPPAPDDFILANYDCADRDFSGFECALCGAKSFFHPKFVG